MKVYGFTFIRNAIKFDYPIVEAIKSILPLCDEIIVAVGDSEDDTMQLIKSIDPKVKVIETVWDDDLREGGRTLALETDKAYAAIPKDADWAFYIQGDEVIHEKYHENILNSMHKFVSDKNVDGLLFDYLHFYGSYQYVGSSLNWYQDEIRIVRVNSEIFSYRDAQGFRKYPNNKLNVKKVDASVFHYGWVKPPVKMQDKQLSFHKMWHNDEWLETNVGSDRIFDYHANVCELSLFQETHPLVMKNRIMNADWSFNYDLKNNKRSFKDYFKIALKKTLNIDLRYKNYNIV